LGIDGLAQVSQTYPRVYYPHEGYAEGQAPLLSLMLHKKIHDQQKRKSPECRLEISEEKLPCAEGNDEDDINHNEDCRWSFHESFVLVVAYSAARLLFISSFYPYHISALEVYTNEKDYRPGIVCPFGGST